MYPLIVIINNLKKINLEIKIFTFLKIILVFNDASCWYDLWMFPDFILKEFNTLLYNFSNTHFSRWISHINAYSYFTHFKTNKLFKKSRIMFNIQFKTIYYFSISTFLFIVDQLS